MRKKSLIIAIFLVVIDQIVKISIDNFLRYSEIIELIPNFFYISKVYNTGAAWSMLSGEILILVGVSLIAMLFLINYQKSFQNNYRNTMAFGLIYGGLLGNLIDRIIYGHVIDYLKMLIFGYNFPIFNLADVAIVVGFILLIYAVIKGEDKVDSKNKRKHKTG